MFRMLLSKESIGILTKQCHITLHKAPGVGTVCGGENSVRGQLAQPQWLHQTGENTLIHKMCDGNLLRAIKKPCAEIFCPKHGKSSRAIGKPHVNSWEAHYAGHIFANCQDRCEIGLWILPDWVKPSCLVKDD